MAEERGIVFIDYNAIVERLNAITDENLIMTVGGVQIDSSSPGNDPYHAQLPDNHIGTVGSGLLANMLFIEPFNAAFGLNIELFSEAEILQIAGITPPTPTPDE
jgi:hypothetical protein